MEQASCLEQVRLIDCEFIHTKNNVCPCGPTISVLPPIRTLISCVCATRAVHHLMPPQITSLCSETVSLCELQVCSVNWQKTLCYHSVPESLYICSTSYRVAIAIIPVCNDVYVAAH